MMSHAQSVSSGTAMRRAIGLGLVVTVLIGAVPVLSWVAYPLRLFVTFIHEACHAIAAVATGGGVHHIEIQPNGSGLTLISGGSPLVFGMAGYVGTTIVGGLTLMALHRRGFGIVLLKLFAVMVATIGILWVRNPFGIVCVGGLLGLLVLASVGKAAKWADYIAAFLAVQLCLNSIMDLQTLWLLTTQTSGANDAVLMSEIIGLPAWFWAGTWAVLGIGICLVSLRAFWRATDKAVGTTSIQSGSL